MVSLIVPCYNAERFIDRCIDSILAQTDNDIELILVNDGSTDNSDKIIKSRMNEIESFVKKFIYVVQENQGVGAACGNAFRLATGQYLSLMDADDYIMPDSIRCRREWLDSHPDFGIVRTNGYYVSEDSFDICNGLLEVNEEMKTKEYIFDDIFDGATFLWPGTYMIRMSVLDDLYPGRKIYPSRSGQNLQFLLMAAYKSKAGFIDIPLMKYVIRKESLSHFSSGDVMKKEMDAMLGYKDIRHYLVQEFMPEDEQEEWNKRIEILYERIFVQISCKYNNKKMAREHYLKLKTLMGGKCDLNITITYFRLINPAWCFVLRVLRKLGIVS